MSDAPKLKKIKMDPAALAKAGQLDVDAAFASAIKMPTPMDPGAIDLDKEAPAVGALANDAFDRMRRKASAPMRSGVGSGVASTSSSARPARERAAACHLSVLLAFWRDVMMGESDLEDLPMQ